MFFEEWFNYLIILLNSTSNQNQSNMKLTMKHSAALQWAKLNYIDLLQMFKVLIKCDALISLQMVIKNRKTGEIYYIMG